MSKIMVEAANTKISTDLVSTRRLIETWLPIAALGEESIRERRSMTALPPTYYLHVWWARRPLVASRAAILASLLPANADHQKFIHTLGIHGDPVAAKRRIAIANRKGERLGAGAYGYGRAFSYSPTDYDRDWVRTQLMEANCSAPTVLDPTAGGGSIPLEAVRLGFESIANDLNPVATLLLNATVRWPAEYGRAIQTEFERIGSTFAQRVRQCLAGAFPAEPAPDCVPDGYLWARTIHCPYCDGLVPLSPHWRLAPDGTGIRLKPNLGAGPGSKGRQCNFEVVQSVKEQSSGTVAEGDATCPFPDCGRFIDGKEIKRQAQAGGMGDELYAVVYKRRVRSNTKGGAARDKWERGYRAPVPSDENGTNITDRLGKKLPDWEALDIVPNEKLPMDTESWTHGNTPAQYGATSFRDLFSARQLYCHGTSVELFRQMLEAEQRAGSLSDVRRAAFVYLALSLDKIIDYNSRQVAWHANREVIDHTFRQHAFPNKWSYAEMASVVTGSGYDWAIKQTGKCIKELIDLVRPYEKKGASAPLFQSQNYLAPPVTITCKSGDSLDHIADKSVSLVVMDPPYYDNVMYAELSDFFYVWLKRTAGHVMPDLFRRALTDKENEAVANLAKFRGQKGARALAARDYRHRMASIFAECHRVLKPGGVMTLMFTHKATGAWDALTMGLMEAAFTISASWPINTEAEGSLHIKNKSAANSTILLVCRPRAAVDAAADTRYWEDVEPAVAKAVRMHVKAFQDAGIGGVDLYLACFGPALEELSRHWPLKRGTPRAIPEERRRRKQAELFEEEWDPYAVTPEDALNAARQEVKRWRLEQLTHMKAHAEMDALTSWFVLAWDAFKAPVFPYDEALRLARAVGTDLEVDVVGRLAEKKGSDIALWDSAKRAAKGALGPPDGSRAMIDAVHHAAYAARSRTLDAARELLAKAQVDKEPTFFAALEAMLEVLPVSKAFTGIDLEGDVAASGSDFEVLENLRRLAFGSEVDGPKQLELWKEVAD